MKMVKHILKQLGVICYFFNHDYVDYTHAKICKRCPSVIKK